MIMEAPRRPAIVIMAICRLEDGAPGSPDCRRCDNHYKRWGGVVGEGCAVLVATTTTNQPGRAAPVPAHQSPFPVGRHAPDRPLRRLIEHRRARTTTSHIRCRRYSLF